MSFLDPKLKQRGRAEVNFLVNLTRGGAPLMKAASEDATKAAGNIAELPDDLDERNEYMEQNLKSSRPFRIQQLLGEWYADNHGKLCTDAFEGIQPDLQEDLNRLASGPTTLELNENFVAPAYWRDVEFHRTATWDAHEHFGYIHGEIIHPKTVGRIFPGGIFKQRKEVAGQAPHKDYKRILEMGTSTAHFTQALAETYPKAEITGIDPSRRVLEHAQRVGNKKGLNWRLIQGCAEDSKLESNYFDMVCSYILLHEMPADAIEKMFIEAYRVLQPGGYMIMSDVPRYADMNKLSVWQADRGAIYGGEPHWRSSASLDLELAAEQAGFIDISAGGMDGKPYPYIITASKPE